MLNSKEIEFIQNNEDAETASLLLHAHKQNDINLPLCIKSIEARRKMKHKSNVWYKNPYLVYPLSVSVEQGSSESTALFKQLIIKDLLKDSTIVTADLTGGMGIDSYFISQIASKHFYFEQNKELFDATIYNFKQLKANNIICNNIDITLNKNQPLKELKKQNISLIYIDPARRDKTNSKTILLQDYQPNIINILPDIFSICNYIIVKISPMADISLNLKLLPQTEKVYVIAVNNECKELLFLLNKNFIEDEPDINCINIKSSLNNSFISYDNFKFKLSNEQSIKLNFANEIESYLYEPNKAILKSGAYKLIAQKYKINKIAVSTHLYTSNSLIENFNGKVFNVKEVIQFNKKNLKEVAKRYEYANIISRNFPLDTNGLKKLSGIKDGGEDYIFAVLLNNKNKILIICKQI